MTSRADTTADRARIALAHDWLYAYRGGEAVLDRLARIVEADHRDANLYLLLHAGAPITPAIDALEPRQSFLARLPMAGRFRRWMLPLYPAAVDALSRTLARDHQREPIDLLLSTSSSAIKGLRPPEGVPHVCYCHSPARYVWAMPEQYAAGRGGLARRAGLAMFNSSFRNWDRRTAAHVTRFIANSQTTATRIADCFGRQADVVHPPVRTTFFTPGEPDPVHLAGLPAPAGEYWLLVGALEPYKRADLAVHAANRAGLPLVVAGAGTMLDELRELAGPTVRVLGRIDDDRLRSLYRGARGLWFPQEEDFGITAVEAMACGTPVLAFTRGGALESVVAGKTGVFFEDASPGALISAIGRMPDRDQAAPACTARAADFAEDVFDERMRKVIADALGRI